MPLNLHDINHIILPFEQLSLDNLFENLIIHNNLIINTYNLNHIIYSNTDVNFQINLLDIINRHFCTSIKNTQQIFRENNKKNNFTLTSFNEYINMNQSCYEQDNALIQISDTNKNSLILHNQTHSFYKLLLHVNNLVTHIKANYNDNKLNTSYVINTAMNNIHRFILHDNIINIAIHKSIHMHLCIDQNNEMQNFIQNIILLSKYKPYNFVNKIDDALVKNIPLIDFNIPTKLLDVYRFKSLYNYMKQNEKKYYYVASIFPNLINVLYSLIKKITNYEINFVKDFIKEYYVELKFINKNKNIMFLFLAKNIICQGSHARNNILSHCALINTPVDNLIEYYDLIEYYGLIYNIFNDTIAIREIIHLKIVSIETSEMIIDLVQIIHNNIISSTPLEFLYIVGSLIKNKDMFLKHLCSKLMYRIIYTHINIETEKVNYILLSKYFSQNVLFQYKIILDDNIASDRYTTECEYKIIITSLDSWNINHTVGNIDKFNINGVFSTKVQKILNNYLQYTDVNNIQKKLIVYPHIGMIDITINDSKTNIILSPAQMLCLELFEHNTIIYKDILFDKLKNQLSLYSDKFIINIIKSFVGSVLKIENDIYIINNNMPDYINLIKIFNDINNTGTNIKKFIEIELAHDRNDILIANINSRIKQVDESFDKLYIYCKKIIKSFEVTTVLFDKAIQEMKDKKYIDMDGKKIMWID